MEFEMFSKLITKIKLYAAPMTRHSELSPEQIAVITQFARGDTACRNKAIAIFRDARFHGIAIESHPDDIYLCVRLLLWILNQTSFLDRLWLRVKPGTLRMHITSLHCFVNDMFLIK
jgi:hypothetical protein